MVPWCGLLRGGRLDFAGETYHLPATWEGHSLHGLARFADFDDCTGTLVGQLPAEWPFGGRVELTPNLSDRALVLEISVIAEHHSMPVAIGWHPWFARHVGASGPLTVGIPADARLLERADDGDPTGRWVDVGAGPWDDCLRTAAPVELTWAGAGRLLIGSDGGYVGRRTRPADRNSARPRQNRRHSDSDLDPGPCDPDRRRPGHLRRRTRRHRAQHLAALPAVAELVGGARARGRSGPRGLSS
jgi:hypothetical protein